MSRPTITTTIAVTIVANGWKTNRDKNYGTDLALEAASSLRRRLRVSRLEEGLINSGAVCCLRLSVLRALLSRSCKLIHRAERSIQYT